MDEVHTGGPQAIHDQRRTCQTLIALVPIAGATQAELMQRLGHSTTVIALACMKVDQDQSRAVAQVLHQHLTVAVGPNK